MRRVFFHIFLGYLLLGLQLGLRDYVSWHGASPNLGLIAAVYMALHLPVDAGLIACLGLGFVQDLLTQHAPGAYAVAYGMTALLVAAGQNILNREHPLTHLTVVLAGGIITMLVLLAQGYLHPAAPRVVDQATHALLIPAARVGFGVLMLQVLYTALVAVPVLFAAQRLARLLSVRMAVKRHRI